MGTYRGYTVSPVQVALRDSAEILGSGLGAIGKNQLATEELGLRRSLQEHQMGRQNEADVRARETYKLGLPALQVQEQENRVKLDRMNQDLTMGHLTGGGDLSAFSHWTSVSESDPSGLNLTQKFENLIGAKYDTNKESPTFGKFVREDGTPMKVRDLEPKWKEATELILSNTDPDHLISDQAMRYQQKVEYLKAQGVPENDPKMVNALTNLKKANALMDRDELKLKMYQKHRDILSKFNNDDAKREVAAIDAKIAKIEEHGYQEKKTKEQQEFQLKLHGQQEASATQRHRETLEANRQPKPTKEGETREIKVGGEIHTEEWNGYKWVPKAVGTGPRTTSGGEATSLQKNVPFVAKKLGITEKEAAEILTETRNKSDQQISTELFKSFLDETGDNALAKQKTQEAMKIIKELRGEKEQQPTQAAPAYDWRQYRNQTPTVRGKIER